MKKNLLFLLLLLSFAFVSSAFAGSIKGQPEELWLTPMGDSNVENTPQNRCRMLKIIKPGEQEVLQTAHNTASILTNYASRLYFEAVKTSFAIDDEDDAFIKSDSASQKSTSEKTILNREIIGKMSNIANRLNIVVSLEARSSALENVLRLTRLEADNHSEWVYDEKTKECKRRR